MNPLKWVHPLKITDVLMQEKIDSLDIITEALVREINLRSIEKKTGRKTEKTKNEQHRKQSRVVALAILSVRGRTITLGGRRPSVS